MREGKYNGKISDRQVFNFQKKKKKMDYEINIVWVKNCFSHGCRLLHLASYGFVVYSRNLSFVIQEEYLEHCD